MNIRANILKLATFVSESDKETKRLHPAGEEIIATAKIFQIPWIESAK